MAFNASIALTWILYLALFPMAFIWLRRAWLILVRRDYSQVAMKGGVAAPDAKRFAPAEAAINLAAGSVCALVIVSVLLGVLDYQTWTAIAGSTIWLKIIASFALGRHAHMGKGGARR
jgi:hypothetical protein